jgi:general secretion pathway protein A
MPFQLSPDPGFLWLGEKHKEALALLKYGVLSNLGFLLLTGDVGTGKTTLINALVNTLGSDTFLIRIADPLIEKMDFFRLIASSLGVDVKLDTKIDFLGFFQEFLIKANEDKKRVLLIIDEAQNLSLDSLEEIRLLSNIEKPNTKLINIFFIGQNGFNDTLRKPECRALTQRLSVVHNIMPLDEKETAEYVKHRLRIAGSNREIFTDGALRKIFAFAKGYPRLINIICDLALVTGYSNDLQTIGPAIIKERSRELSLPGETRQKPPSKVKQRIWRSLNRSVIVGIFAGLALVLAVSGFFIDYKFLVNDGFFLKKYFGAIFSTPHQKSSESTSSPPISLSSQVSRPSTTVVAPESPKNNTVSSKIEKSETIAAPTPEIPFGSDRLIIHFGFNENELPSTILPQLDDLARYLLQKPNTEILIRGYTDELGNPDYNRNLSASRANAVKGYLTGKGISPNRMKVMAMGNASPRKPNTTPEGRSANRRVEIELAIPQS